MTRPSSGDVVEVNSDPLSGTFGQQLAVIPVPGTPDGIAIAANGQRAYVTDRLEGVVYELDVDAGSTLYRRLLREITVPNALLTGGIAVDADWVADQARAGIRFAPHRVGRVELPYFQIGAKHAWRKSVAGPTEPFADAGTRGARRYGTRPHRR